MTTFSIEEIKRLATLSALHFSEEELNQFASEFEGIANFVQKIVDAKIEDCELCERSINLEDLREDIVEESLAPESVLYNSPKIKSGSFCVPKMME